MAQHLIPGREPRTEDEKQGGGHDGISVIQKRVVYVPLHPRNRAWLPEGGAVSQYPRPCYLRKVRIRFTIVCFTLRSKGEALREAAQVWQGAETKSDNAYPGVCFQSDM